ncbi:MAG: VapE domain-containing protein [Bacteroidales bacterium]
MKITILSPSTKTSRASSVVSLVEKLKKEFVKHRISDLRRLRPFSNQGLNAPFRDLIPLVNPSCHFHHGTFKSYNGLVTLEIRQLPTLSHAKTLRDRVAQIPQTHLAFIGCSGLSVKIIIRFTLPDGSIPRTKHLAQLFHKEACQRASDFFKMQIDHRIEVRSCALEYYIRLSHDPESYYNPNSIAVTIEQPSEEIQENKWLPTPHEIPTNDNSINLRRIFKSKEEIDTFNFSEALIKALAIDHNENPHIYRRNFIIAFMKGCFASGIEEEQAVYNILQYGNMKNHEEEVRSLFRSGYEMEKHFGKSILIPRVQLETMELKSFMERRYEVRRNTLNEEIEYRQKLNFFTPFKSVDKFALNTISIEALSEGLKVWDRDISRYIFSSRTPAYNPIDKYLEELPQWDGMDHIGDMARRIKCSNQELWIENFKTWFLGMVAGWRQLNKLHANSSLPLLIGDQACGKSTFCKRILPPELQVYYTDSIDISKKQDAMLSLTRYTLINLDEFDSISSSYQSFLKHVVQKPVVNIRRPYESSCKPLRRYSSFIATCNNHDLLSDPTGSRRYLCVKIEGVIDNQKAINYPQLYAQAVAQLNSGVRYWFDQAQAKQQSEANSEFDLKSTEETLLLHYFEPTEDESKGEWISPTEIYLYIRNMSKLKLGNKGINSFGRIFKKHNFLHRRVRHGTQYLVKKVN